MKNTFILLLYVCISLGANAQLLWQISGNGLTKPSYVFGTHHLSPLSILDSIIGFKQVMNDVGQVYGELVMDDMKIPINMQKVQQATLLPGDTTLQTLMTEAQYDSIALKIKQLMGVELKMMNKLKPAALTSQIAVILAMKSMNNFNPQQQLDGWIQTEARKQGKKVYGLETIDIQIKVLFNSQSLQRQAEQLFCTLMHLDLLDQMSQKMTIAYLNQDIDLIEKIMKEKMDNACDFFPEEEEELNYGRNANWVKLMPPIMKEKSTLFTVGSGHLPGKLGVLNMLGKQGYTIKPVK